MKNLVIVEAAGKVDSLKRELKGIGLFADVMATVGHIADNPKSLVPVALDDELRELSYAFRPDREALLEKIRRAAVGADRIFVATDDDQEGDVIAHDVSRLLSEHTDKLFRVRLRAITGPELHNAFTGDLSRSFEPFARNGVCRRIVDRAIGSTFTYVNGKHTVPVGRVQSSLLASIAAHPPEAGRYTLSVKIGDESVFGASVPIFSAGDLAKYERIAAALAKGQARTLRHVEEQEPVSSPWGYEEVVAQISERLRRPIDEAADLFQDAYEKGRVSYPRVRTGAYTPEAVEVGVAIAQNNRCSFARDALPLREVGEGGVTPHECPRVYDEDLVLGRTLSVLDPTEAVAVLVARNMIECGQVTNVRKLTVEVDGMELTLQCRPDGLRRNWKRPEPETGYHAHTREVAILRYMGARNLGRPSTVVGHAVRLVQRGLIEDTGIAVELNERGRRWLARAVETGFTAETSSEMERAIARPMRDPHARAAEVLRAHGMLESVTDFIRTVQSEQQLDAGLEPV